MRCWTVVMMGSAMAAPFGFSLTPDAPMCELLAKPGLVAVTDATPEFSWLFKEGMPQDFQTAYQIQVASSTELFKTGNPDLWDSGKVESGQSLYIAYAGSPLPVSANVNWRVRVWNRKNKPGAWSQTLAFATAEKLGDDSAVRYPVTQRQVKPSLVMTNAQGRVFVDFGKAAFGWVELLPPRDILRGGPFTLHLGEKSSGYRVDNAPGGSIRYVKVRGALTNPGIYRVPLEADKQNTCGSSARLANDFGVVMPFRYVEVEECPYPVTKDSIRQIAINYPFDDNAARFVSSDAMLDRVYAFCKYTVKATTFAGVYVNGDRERIPCEADAYINQLCHYGVDREFTLARYSHEYLMRHPTWPTEWKQHSVMMAWTDWMYTGNTESLSRCYGELKSKKTLEACAREKDGLLVTGGPEAPVEGGLRDIVDWPAGERDGFEFKPVNAVVNAFYCLNLRQMSEMALALDKVQDSAIYRLKAERAQNAFHALFFNPERGCYLDGEGAAHASLHANMLPLAFGLVPEEERGRVATFVQSRGMACSVYGAQFLLESLFETGLEDEALRLMTRDDRRSWANMIRSGSTISMEAWDSIYMPNLDWNHARGAAPANIIPRYVLGVRPLLAGFGKILIRPQVGSLDAVQGFVPTVRGSVTVGVRQTPGNSYRLMIELPLNTTGRLELPWAEGALLTVDGKRYRDPLLENGRLVLDNVASGHHVVAWQTREETSCDSNSGRGSPKIFSNGWRAWLPFF